MTQSAPSTDVAGNSPRREAVLCLLLLVFSCICYYGGHFYHGTQAFSMVEDDLFYYLKIAANLAAGHGSTFDGQTATNGYHPLWMVIIAFLSIFTHNLKHLIAEIYLLAVVATLATFLFSRRIIGRFVHSAALADGSAVLVTLFAANLYRSGMEIIATLPLALSLIVLVLSSQRTLTPARVFGMTMLASFVVLARIDSAILIGLLGVLLFLETGVRRIMTPRHFLAVGLGSLPLAIYLCTNIFIFGTLLPISGNAKQLRTAYVPSMRAFRSTPWICPLHGLPFFAAIVGLIWLLIVRKRLDAVPRATLTAMLIFPVAQMSLLSVLSDWIVFPWYFYSSAIALCAAFCVVLGVRTAPRWTRGRAAPFLAGGLAVICALYAARIMLSTWYKPPSQRVMAGYFVKNFASSHPGRYAMGDRAGFAGAVLPDPMVQLEGLVMDKQFLHHIQHEDNLLSVLREYRVDYYVATRMSGGPPHGCYEATEPSQAGETAPHMKASLCMPPVAVYQTPNGITTMIFALKAP